MQEKLFIKNRNKEKVAILVDTTKNPRGLVFIVHGLGGSKDQPHMKTMADVFIDNNYDTISFDTTNAYGESDGNPEDATVTQHLHDLEDVITWAETQEWYEEPFILVGHSLGAFCSLLYTEKFPKKVRAIAPISTVVSGELNVKRYSKKEVEKWKKEGIRQWVGYAGNVKRLKWKYIEDGKKYDILPEINKIKVPVLLIVGNKDASTPVKDQQLLYTKLRGKKEIHIIEGSEHTFRSDAELKELKILFSNWIKKL